MPAGTVRCVTVTSDAPSREPTGRPAAGRSPGPSWSVTSGSEDLPRWASIGFWVVVAGAVVVRFAATSDLWLDEALSGVEVLGSLVVIAGILVAQRATQS